MSMHATISNTRCCTTSWTSTTRRLNGLLTGRINEIFKAQCCSLVLTKFVLVTSKKEESRQGNIIGFDFVSQSSSPSTPLLIIQ